MKPSQDQFDLVSGALAGATSEQAYCLGLVCAMLWTFDQEVPREVIEGIRTVRSDFATTYKLAEQWCRRHQRKARRGKAAV